MKRMILKRLSKKLSEFLENPSDKKFVVQKKDFEKKKKNLKKKL